jgi:hypothetical protein
MVETTKKQGEVLIKKHMDKSKSLAELLATARSQRDAAN